MKLFIITGGSRGLGQALCKQFESRDYTILEFSRSAPHEYSVRIDLADPEQSRLIVANAVASIDPGQLQELIVVSNAGMLEPIGPTSGKSYSDLMRNMNTNFVSAVLVLTEIVARFQAAECRKVIVNISSGAALRARAGWSLYCAAKAGMENFIPSLALEQQVQPQPFLPINVDPGLIDTEMQGLIRGTSPQDFPDVELFVQRKEQGLLVPRRKSRRPSFAFSNYHPFHSVSDIRHLNMVDSMNQIKQHFEEEAHKFDEIIQQLIPYYDQMLQALISAVPFDDDYPMRILDAGCGTGTVTQHILQVFPQSHVTCLDFSEQMIEMAKVKLARFDRVSYLVQDFREYTPTDPYHAVVSSLALHHLVTEAEKKTFYQKIHENLLPGGCFYNADVVLGASDHLQSTYMQRWKAFMQRQISEEEVENVWLQKYSEEDRPAQLVEQLTWLSDIGYRNVDILWKYYNFAVYGGVKAGTSG